MFRTRFSPLRAALRVRRPLLQLLCVLLLFAQHVGLAHALWHAVRALPTERQVASKPAERPDGRELTTTCALDAVLTQVLGIGPAATHGFYCEPLPPQSLQHADYGIAVFNSPTARSRGPPLPL